MSPFRIRALPGVSLIVLCVLLAACSAGLTSNSSKPTAVGTSAPTTAPIASTAAGATTAPATPTALPAGTANPTRAASATSATNATSAATTTTLTSAPVNASGQLLSVAEINKRVRPAVVQITNNQKQTGRFGSNGPAIPAGVGTGFIYDKRGFIMTNNHVVEGASSLTVATTDNKTYDAKIIGTYPDNDLAVIQINGNGDLPTVPLGDSSQLQVGDPVVAIGNALALDGGPTVTSGVVSALGRTVQEPGDSSQGSQATQGGALLIDTIQTDAAINPGNSGGPLLNGRGEVIGINTLVAGQAEPGVTAQGIGFAISINSAKPVADALMNHQPVPRPFVGISYGPLSPTQDAQLNLPANTGAVIATVQSGSPADKAGLQKNDVILKIDGQDVRGESGFPSLLLRHKPGDTITLTILRGSKQQDVQVTLAQAPSK